MSVNGAGRLLTAAVWSLLIPGAAGPARGDGGALRLSEHVGPYRISVFTSPGPLRVGAADISVFVQDAGSGAPVADAGVRLTLTPAAGNGAGLTYTATVEQATNKLLRAAAVDLPAAGPWRIEVAVEGPRGLARCSVSVLVAEPLPRWRQMWPWFTWPAVPIVLFVLYQLTRPGRRSAPNRARC
jgi:hypothetical protein